MKRSLRPAVESLEGKALLTASPLMGSAGLVYSLSAVEFQSGGHEEVQLSMTIRNTGTQSKSFVVAPSLDGFVAKQNGKIVWESNAGPTAMYISRVTLAPGQSRVISAVWDETSNVGSLKPGTPITGNVTFDNQFAPDVTSQVTIGKVRPGISFPPPVAFTLKH